MNPTLKSLFGLLLTPLSLPMWAALYLFDGPEVCRLRKEFWPAIAADLRRVLSDSEFWKDAITALLIMTLGVGGIRYLFLGDWAAAALSLFMAFWMSYRA